MDVNEALAEVGVRVPDVLIPRSGIDLQAWAVVACDQFTSQPEYWQQARELVGDQPSTLNLIFPEVYLGQPDSEAVKVTEGVFTYVAIDQDRKPRPLPEQGPAAPNS